MSIVLLGSTSGSCTLQEQAVAGTTTLTLPTTSGTVALTSGVALTLGFTSANQAVPTATNTAYTVAHTLGVVPKIVRLVAVCTTAASGYSIGDETEVLLNSSTNGNLQSFYWASASTVGWYSASAMIITDRATGASVSLISNANFALKVYAFA
jgi:hypothetical protein